MGYRDSDQTSGGVSHGMGRDADDLRHGQRGHSVGDAYQDHGHGGAYGFLRNSPGGRVPGSASAPHDEDRQWRDEALRLLDEDYDAWRQERYQSYQKSAQGFAGAPANPYAGPASRSVRTGNSGATSSKGKEPLG